MIFRVSSLCQNSDEPMASASYGKNSVRGTVAGQKSWRVTTRFALQAQPQPQPQSIWLMEWMVVNGVELQLQLLEDWPPFSPDLNPIGMLYQVLNSIGFLILY